MKKMEQWKGFILIKCSIKFCLDANFSFIEMFVCLWSDNIMCISLNSFVGLQLCFRAAFESVGVSALIFSVGFFFKFKNGCFEKWSFGNGE